LLNIHIRKSSKVVPGSGFLPSLILFVVKLGKEKKKTRYG
jgi:hypothetical protein